MKLAFLSLMLLLFVFHTHKDEYSTIQYQQILNANKTTNKQNKLLKRIQLGKICVSFLDVEKVSTQDSSKRITVEYLKNNTASKKYV